MNILTQRYTVNKKIIVALGILVAIAVLVFGYRQFVIPPSGQSFDVAQKQTVVNKALKLSFSYPGGPDGLSLIEPPMLDNGVIKAYLLMPTDEYEMFQTTETPKETPAAISVFVFGLEDEEVSSSTQEISRITRLQNWAIDNTSLTSFTNPKTEPEIVELDGLKAFYYKVDGLYQQDIYLASYRGFIYMFAAQYDKESDITFRAFQELITSLSFD
jgi:hypothetical protein